MNYDEITKIYTRHCCSCPGSYTNRSAGKWDCKSGWAGARDEYGEIPDVRGWFSGRIINLRFCSGVQWGIVEFAQNSTNGFNGSSLCQEHRNAVQLSLATNQRFHIFEYHLCFGEMKEKRPFLTYDSPNQTLHQRSTNWEVWILMFFFFFSFYFYFLILSS